MLAYVHQGGSTPLTGLTIGAFLREIAAKNPGSDAIVSPGQNITLTYAEFIRQVDGLAKGLIAMGVAKGDRVGIWSTNNAEWVVLQLATARIGAILVNINPAYRVHEFEHALHLAKIQTLFFIPSFRSSDYVATISDLCPEVSRLDPDEFAAERFPYLHRLVVYDPDDSTSTPRPDRALLTWSEILQRGEAISDSKLRQRSADLDADDPINIQFTSGTTGFPKAVILTHHNILNNSYFTGEIMDFDHRDRLCVPVPFYHCFGMVISNLACLTHGAAIIIPAPHFDAKKTLASIQEERCTAIHGVPTMFIDVLEHPDFEAYDLSSLRTGIMAGAPCPPGLMQRVMDKMDCPEILIGYGQTESSPVTHLTRSDDSFAKRTLTVGTNLPHQEVKVIDVETGDLCARGQAGEVCFRGYHVMRGYFEKEQATREAIDEAGWLHSGDLAVMDEDGYLSIKGRLKNMIIRGGQNIYPAEIEALFYLHPKVAEVAVFGIEDPRMGEEVGAWIKLHQGMVADPDELKEYAKGQISHFKVPKHIWLVDEFPITVTGKIQKFRIRETVARWLEPDENREVVKP